MYAESTTTEMTAYPGREPPEKATLRDFWAKESAVNAFLQTSHVNIPNIESIPIVANRWTIKGAFWKGATIILRNQKCQHFLLATPKAI